MITSCANPIAPKGGPKDEIAPVLDTTKSFQNYQTNYEKGDITLYFDEFVNLKDPGKQVVISPPLSLGQQTTGRGKKVQVKFSDEEELKENATYVINFGDAITDFTEGNILDNFRLVFSTGAYIDSLRINGTVKDAITAEPTEDVLVMLYLNRTDSVVYRDRPFYFAKTDENGQFSIQNLRADTFKVFALKDQNLNYIYDLPTEQIGFVDAFVELTDSATIDLGIELFKERKPARYLSYELISKGHVELTFDEKPDLTSIAVFDSIQHSISLSSSAQKLDLWYAPASLSELKILIQKDSISRDTVSLRLRNADDLVTTLSTPKFGFDSKVGLHPDLPLEIEFGRPIAKIDSFAILLVDTLTADTMPYTIESNEMPKKVFELNTVWRENSILELTILPTAFVDLFGYTTDTIVQYLNVAERIDFGIIDLEFTGLDSSIAYVVELLLNNEVLKTETITISKTNLYFERLVPETYSLKITFDQNENGIWDPGNYLMKTQSEDIYTMSLEKLKDNWILEKTIDVRQLNNKVDDTEDR